MEELSGRTQKILRQWEQKPSRIIPQGKSSLPSFPVFPYLVYTLPISPNYLIFIFAFPFFAACSYPKQL